MSLPWAATRCQPRTSLTIIAMTVFELKSNFLLAGTALTSTVQTTPHMSPTPLVYAMVIVLQDILSACRHSSMRQSTPQLNSEVCLDSSCLLMAILLATATTVTSLMVGMMVSCSKSLIILSAQVQLQVAISGNVQCSTSRAWTAQARLIARLILQKCSSLKRSTMSRCYQVPFQSRRVQTTLLLGSFLPQLCLRPPIRQWALSSGSLSRLLLQASLAQS